MTCREVQTILTEEIQLAESADVRKHLEVCRKCRDLHRDLLSLQELSGKLKGRTTAPRFFTERVCSRVSGRSRAAYWSLAATAAGLVLIGVGVLSLTGLSTESDGKAGSRAMIGGDRIQKIEDNREAAVFQESQPDVLSLGGEESASQETDRAVDPTHGRVRLVVPKASSSGYVLELPAAIEVRQTQADNEFYLENVSH